MEFSEAFIKAFKHAMIWEVGAHFNFDDPEVKAGKCETILQKRKVGYVNHKDDPGGETKFGIAKNANPDVDIKSLDLHTAMSIYFTRYWKPARCEEFDYILSICLFDAAVNHGVSAAAKMLQQSVGVVADGKIGPITINATKQFKSAEICDKILKLRENLFHSIVQRKPTQKIFLKGWLARISGLRAYLFLR